MRCKHYFAGTQDIVGYLQCVKCQEILPIDAPADREPVADQMRAVADWCAAHVGDIPAQIKTRAPGEMASMLHWLADYIEGKREDVRDLFVETPDALEDMARHVYYSSHDRAFTEAIAEIEAKLLPLYARIYAGTPPEQAEGEDCMDCGVCPSCVERSRSYAEAEGKTRVIGEIGDALVEYDQAVCERESLRDQEAHRWDDVCDRVEAARDHIYALCNRPDPSAPLLEALKEIADQYINNPLYCAFCDIQADEHFSGCPYRIARAAIERHDAEA